MSGKESNRSPLTIQGLWIGERLSVLEQLCVSSFLANGHDFHLYVYDEMDGVPKGTRLHDANEILPESSIFTYRKHRSVAGFSNTFRYKLLAQRGGCWVDMDVVCLRPLGFACDHAFVRGQKRSRLGWVSRRAHVPNWFIKAPVGSQIMTYCYERAVERKPQDLEWGDTGPKLLTKAVELFDMGHYVVPEGTFCPLHWWHWRTFVDGSAASDRRWRRASRHAVAVHVYNEMWRRAGIEKDGQFPAASVYEELKRRYLG